MLDYDYVFCITVTASRSPIFQNATKASFAILSDYKSIRGAAGIKDAFALRVVDSRNLFCGTGVLVARSGAPGQVQGRSQRNPPSPRRAARSHLRLHGAGRSVLHPQSGDQEGREERLALLTYAIGTALDIKPVILCYRGETQAVAKVRSYERAVERMFEHVAAQIERGIDTQACLHQLRRRPGAGCASCRATAQLAAGRAARAASSCWSASCRQLQRSTPAPAASRYAYGGEIAEIRNLAR